MPRGLADRMGRLSPSATMEVRRRTEELRRAGADVIDLGPGEPDFDTPDYIKEAAVKALQAFEAANPDSLWLPVCRDLRNKAKYELDRLANLTEEGLTAVLIQLLTRWQKAVARGDRESLEPLRRAFGDLAVAQRPGLDELAAGQDANLRAIAVFCLAFGDGDQDLPKVVAACADPEARVRAWAVYGLAERRKPLADTRLLERALSDQNPDVRERACAAIEACIGPGSPDRRVFVGLLLDVVRDDPVENVRAAAAGALGGLARAIVQLMLEARIKAAQDAARLKRERAQKQK